MNTLKIFLLVLLLAFSESVFSQQLKNSSVQFESKYHYGFLMSHRPMMRHLQQAHTQGMEFCISKQTNGEKLWQAYHDYPVIGVMYLNSSLGNHDVLGNVNALYAFLNFHLTPIKKTTLNFRFAAGIGYLSNKFDRLNNYKNIAIGSHFNASIDMSYELRYALSDKFQFASGLGLTHFSNGAFKTPNLGVNIPSLNAGITYVINPVNRFVPTQKDSLKRKSEIYTIFSGGMKQVYPACGDYYAAFTWSSAYALPLSPKRKFSVGLDFFLDYSNLRSLKRINELPKHDFQVYKAGIFVGHQIVFSNLTFLTELGYYYRTLYKADGFVYTRIGLRYKFNKHFFANLSLKTHYAKADFLEWGIGYKIK